MTPEAPETRPETRPRARRRLWPWALALVPAGLIVGTIARLNEPLAPVASRGSLGPIVRDESFAGSVEKSEVGWPEGRLEGEPAKRLLLDVLRSDREKIAKVAGYTATFRKQERIKGKLGKLQTIAMKVRNAPFSVYLKYLAPKAGREAVFVEGKHDNHVIGHNGDWSRRLLPRLKVAPDSPLALADNRHPITEAGLLNLVNKLVGFRELDLEDPEAMTFLDRTTDDRGRAWLRSLHLHPEYHEDRPFARVEILYDPATKLPMRITSYDWPKPGHRGDLDLAEFYAYDDLRLDAPLSELDFDPANPEYAFTRF